jgi:general secretion pathway protein N
VQGRIRLEGALQLELAGMSSRLVALESVGSYRLDLAGGAGSEGPVLTLSTLAGPLQLAGRGQWTGSKLRFQGEAAADAGAQAALDNLLNVIGQRSGARSIISIR